MKTIFTVLVEKLLVGRPPEKLIWAWAPSRKGESTCQRADTPSHVLVQVLSKDRLPFQAIIVTGMLTLVGTNKSGKEKSPETWLYKDEMKKCRCLSLKKVKMASGMVNASVSRASAWNTVSSQNIFVRWMDGWKGSHGIRQIFWIPVASYANCDLGGGVWPSFTFLRHGNREAYYAVLIWGFSGNVCVRF